MSTRIEGRAILLGDDVDADNILPGPYLNLTDPEELGKHLLEHSLAVEALPVLNNP